MSLDLTTGNGAVERLWNRFVDRARKHGVKEAAVRWKMRRAEAYLKAFPDKRLAEYSRKDAI